MSRINGIQMAQATNFSHNLQILEKDLVSEYNNILAQEEVLWFQKSRAINGLFKEKETSDTSICLPLFEVGSPKSQFLKITITIGLMTPLL